MKSINIKVSTRIYKHTGKSWYKIELDDQGNTTTVLKKVKYNCIGCKEVTNLLSKTIADRILELVPEYTDLNIHTQTTDRQHNDMLYYLVDAGKNIHVTSTKVTRDFYDEVSLLDFPDGVKCSVCSKLYPINSYVFNTRSRQHSTRCKSCNSKIISQSNTSRIYASPENMIKGVVYPNMKKVIKEITNNSPERKLSLEFIGPDDLISYLKEIDQWDLFCNNFDNYIKNDRDRFLAPAIGRILKDVGYNRGNIKVCTFIESVSGVRKHSASHHITLNGTTHSGVSFRTDMDVWVTNRTYIVNGEHQFWKSVFPTKEIANKYSKKVTDEIVTYGIPKTEEIRIDDWKKLWPDAYIERKINKVKSRDTCGHIQKQGNYYNLTLRKVGNNRLMGGIFPTRKLADEFGIKLRVLQLQGKQIPRIKKRDWVTLGFKDKINFNKQLNKNGTYTLNYIHDSTKFSAYIIDPSWQDKYVNDLIVNDLRTNGRITTRSIRKLDWAYIPKPGLINER